MGDRDSSASGGDSLEQLPLLVARLGDDLVALVESRLRLLQVEITADATAYLRGAVVIAAGGLLATVGFVLWSVGLALLVAEVLPSDLHAPQRYVGGFLVVGSALLSLGLGLYRRARHRMVIRDLAALGSG